MEQTFRLLHILAKKNDYINRAFCFHAECLGAEQIHQLFHSESEI